MCGITGFYNNLSASGKFVSDAELRNMTAALQHRGPDGAGTWINERRYLGFGHRRLSVIDLTSSAQQPMVSNNNRYVLTYNGEIYNYTELRTILEKKGVKFKSHSDTEVILYACIEWGPEQAVKKMIGMFAFAFWDNQENILYLARDRIGIKPLYWGRIGGLFLFSSELKSIRQCSSFTAMVDKDSLRKYMQFNYVPAPNSIYENVHKLPAGNILTLKYEGEPVIKPYWQLNEVVNNQMNDRKDYSEISDEIEYLLHDSITRRMVSDVPLGTFLSGGIDSSLVTAVMQKESTSKIKTFTIGFEEENYNEAVHARKIAKYLGTEHTELYVKSLETIDVIPEMAQIYDEPFADSSQIPTYILSKLTREHVTVALSGDGGDEIFAGYNRYLFSKRFMSIFNSLPRNIRILIAKVIFVAPSTYWDKIAALLMFKNKIPQYGDKLYKLAELLRNGDKITYNKIIKHWNADVMLAGNYDVNSIDDFSISANVESEIEKMQINDTLGYLPDDILTKVDRASMAVSLEVRVPLLDHRLIEKAWQLRMEDKIKRGKGKWPLREILRKYLPNEYIDRPKMGFGIPLGEWLRGPLRDWAESLINENDIEDQGLLNSKIIREKWNQHLSGERNWQYHLWDVLMFQSWHNKWMS